MSNKEHEPYSAIENFQPECERAIRSWWTWPRAPRTEKIATERKFAELAELKHAVGSPSRLA